MTFDGCPRVTTGNGIRWMSTGDNRRNVVHVFEGQGIQDNTGRSFVMASDLRLELL